MRYRHRDASSWHPPSTPIPPLLKLRQGSVANHIGGAQGRQVPEHRVLHHTDGHLAFARVSCHKCHHFQAISNHLKPSQIERFFKITQESSN